MFDVPLGKDRAGLARVWEEHTAQEFVRKDVDAAMRAMTADAHVVHVPVATGARGRTAVGCFYAERFVGRIPEDARLGFLSRTAGAGRVVDEMLFSFTHDVEMPWMLPGIAPTGRRVEIPIVVVVAFRGGLVESEHVYWDQASVLAQIGLLDPSGLPVLGSAQPWALVDRAAPSSPA